MVVFQHVRFLVHRSVNTFNTGFQSGGIVIGTHDLSLRLAVCSSAFDRAEELAALGYKAKAELAGLAGGGPAFALFRPSPDGSGTRTRQ